MTTEIFGAGWAAWPLRRDSQRVIDVTLRSAPWGSAGEVGISLPFGRIG